MTLSLSCSIAFPVVLLLNDKIRACFMQTMPHATPPLRAIHGRLADDGFVWIEHSPHAWPELCAHWESAGGTSKPWWLCILRRGAATLAWGGAPTTLNAGSIAGGRIPPALCQWSGESMRNAAALTLLLARGAPAKLIGPLRGAPLPPALERAIEGKFPEMLALSLPHAGFDLAAWADELLAPPGPAFTHALFYQARALEAITLLAGSGATRRKPVIETPAGGPTATHARRELLARERVSRAQSLIAENLEEPLNLRELSRRVGCSPFYLSRTFSAHAGCTLQDYQRRTRLHRAAELLRGGAHNVTEAAMAVGYSSLSHFTKAFRETFGCCPGLYPVAAPRAPGR